MEARFRVTNTDDMEFSMTFTESLKYWKELEKQISESELCSSRPSYQLLQAIQKLVKKATAHFECNDQEEGT